MRETWYPGRWPEQRYDAAFVERCRLAELRARPFVPKAPVVPVEYVPPANAKPLAIAMGLLMHELAVSAAPVAVLVAKAAKLGVSVSTLRRAKKACGGYRAGRRPPVGADRAADTLKNTAPRALLSFHSPRRPRAREAPAPRFPVFQPTTIRCIMTDESTDEPRIKREKTDGRFKAGNAGRPRGSRGKAAVLAEKLAAKEIADIVNIGDRGEGRLRAKRDRPAFTSVARAQRPPSGLRPSAYPNSRRRGNRHRRRPQCSGGCKIVGG
jgi:hypothetical protein